MADERASCILTLRDHWEDEEGDHPPLSFGHGRDGNYLSGNCGEPGAKHMAGFGVFKDTNSWELAKRGFSVEAKNCHRIQAATKAARQTYRRERLRGIGEESTPIVDELSSQSIVFRPARGICRVSSVQNGISPPGKPPEARDRAPTSAESEAEIMLPFDGRACVVSMVGA